MLIYEEYRDIFAVMSKSIECLFDGRVLGLGIDDEEILLRIRWLCNVLKGS